MVEILRHHGHAVTRLREVMPKGSPDEQVISRAATLDAILLSLNGDFSDIVAYPPANYAGIIAVQLHNHPEIIPHVMARLTAFLAANPAQAFYRQKLFLVEGHRVRVRQ